MSDKTWENRSVKVWRLRREIDEYFLDTLRSMAVKTADRNAIENTRAVCYTYAQLTRSFENSARGRRMHNVVAFILARERCGNHLFLVNPAHTSIVRCFTCQGSCRRNPFRGQWFLSIRWGTTRISDLFSGSQRGFSFCLIRVCLGSFA